MHRGYIKLWRKITEWGWYGEGNTFRVFLHLLINANHKESIFMGHRILRGDIVIGLHTLSNTLDMSVQTCRTCLNRLKSTNEITIKTTNRFSIITLIKYEDYQSDEEKATNDSTNKLTINQQTTNKQLTTSKEYISSTSTSIIDTSSSKATFECKNEKNKESPSFQSDSLPFRLSELLWESIKNISPSAKPPNLQSWAKEFDLIMRIDKRDADWIRQTMLNARKDPFWQSNILSPSKLRIHLNSGKLEKFVPTEWRTNKQVIETIKAKKETKVIESEPK